MHYCLVICRVSSTEQIYHRAAKRWDDKFDRSMTRGKLLGNNAQLFILISILIMTQLISFLHSLLTAVRTGRLGVLPIRIYRGNNAVFVSVDLIGEKNQVIFDYLLSDLDRFISLSGGLLYSIVRSSTVINRSRSNTGKRVLLNHLSFDW